MKNQIGQAKWVLLALFLLAYILLAVVFQRMALSNVVREVIQIMLFLVITILAYAWFEASEFAPEPPALSSHPEDSAVLKTPLAVFPTPHFLRRAVFSLLAAALILALTFVMAAGRGLLGDGVVTLIYLVPIAWTTVRWGRIPGASAALSAALCFDFFFVPPFFTFRTDSLEGWLLLGIFMLIALAVVGRTVEQFTAISRRVSDHSLLSDLLQNLGSLRSREEMADYILDQLLRYYSAGFARIDLYPRDGWTHQHSLYSREARPDDPLNEFTLLITSRDEVIGKIVLGNAVRPIDERDSPLLVSVMRLVALSVDSSLPAHVPGRIA